MSSTYSISRRGVLFGLGVLGAGSLASCSGSHALKGTARIREEIKTLAPTEFVQTYHVDPAGGAGSYPTLAAATEAVMADKKKRLGTDSVMLQGNLWDWRCIEVAAGTYQERLNLPPHTAIIGRGHRPEDVKITFDGDNTVETTGRSAYLSNLHVEHTSTSATAHPHRDSGSSGDIGLGILQRRTVVFDKVRFTAGEGAGIGKCSNDMVPRQGVSMVFHDCTFEAVDQPQSINLVTNVGLGTGAATIAFIGCKVISNLKHNPDPDTGKVVMVAAAPIGATDGGYNRGDSVLFADGAWQVGTGGGVQGLLVLPFAPSQDFKHTMKNVTPKPSTHWYVDKPGSVPNVRTILSQNGALTPTAQVPDSFKLPAQCQSEQELAFFGAKPAATPEKFGTGLTGQNQPLDVTGGDTYWVRVPLRGHAFAIQGLAVPGSVQPGFSFSVYLENKDKPDPRALLTNGAAKPGSANATCNLAWAYPGQGSYVWVAVVFSGAGKVSAVAAQDGSAFHAQGVPGTAPDPASASMSAIEAEKSVPAIEVISHLPAGMA